MKTKDVVATIKKHRGPILVGMLVKDDIIYVRVIKKDIIHAIEGLSDNVIRCSVVDDELYIDDYT